MMKKPILIYALSLLGFALFWAALAALRGDARILPGPGEVLGVLWQEAMSGRLWRHLGMTLWRMAAAFGLAMAIGTALGLWLGRHPRAEVWARVWVTIFLNLPALVVIVLCYLWIGLNEVAVVVAVAINKTAMVTVALRDGARGLAPGLEDMSHVFRLTRWQRLCHVHLPQLAPFVLTAARAGIAMIWKVVLVAEFLGRSSGIGFQIHLNFQLFEIAKVLAYALAFVAVMVAIEIGIFAPLERRVSRWRGPDSPVSGADR